MIGRAFHQFRSGIQSRPYFFISFLLTAVVYMGMSFGTDWQWSTNFVIQLEYCHFDLSHPNDENALGNQSSAYFKACSTAGC